MGQMAQAERTRTIKYVVYLVKCENCLKVGAQGIHPRAKALRAVHIGDILSQILAICEFCIMMRRRSVTIYEFE